MDSIFIVGTGRSGTHFLTRVLLGFQNLRDPLGGRENSVLLRSVATAAICHRTLPDAVLAKYQAEAAAASGVFLDQHHPNLLFVKQIAAAIPGAVFLFPDRPTHQVVASMMRHHGVMAWYDYARNWRRWFRDPVPSPTVSLASVPSHRSRACLFICCVRIE